MKTIINFSRIRLGLISHPSGGGWIAGIMLRLNLKRPLNKAGHHPKKLKARFKASFPYDRLTTREKIDLGNDIYMKMDCEPIFTDPDPSMNALHAATVTMERAYYNYISGGESERQTLKAKVEIFDMVFKGVIKYLDEFAMGRKEIYDKIGIPFEKIRGYKRRHK